jgi:hypothetical protein
MKWFKHDCDMHTDLKIQNLIEKHGLEGYAIWNLCLEMVGKEGSKGKIDGQLRWRQLISKVAGWSDNGKIDKIINTMASLDLICRKSLKYGNLYIPKFIKRADDYTSRKLRTQSEHPTDKVHLDKIIDKIRKEKRIDNTPDIPLSYFYKRYGKAAKELLMLSGQDVDVACKAIDWVSGWCKEKGLNWELETVNKHFLSGLTCGFKGNAQLKERKSEWL